MTDELQIPELDDIVMYSELKLLLDNVCNMFDSYIRMSSRKGSQYQLRAFTIELAMVTLKLKALHKRWQIFLPFREVIDVDFATYENVAHHWLKMFDEQEDSNDDDDYFFDIQPLSNGYLLDLLDYEIEPFKTGMKPDELSMAVENYCKTIDKYLRKPAEDNWEEKVFSRLEADVQALVADDEENGQKDTTIAVIKAYAEALHNIEELFTSDLKEEQFIILANRLIYRDCKKAVKEAKDQVKKEHNAWPKKFEKDRAIAKKEQIKMLLLKNAHGDDLKEYIDLDYPELLEDACFGQYLFRDRQKLTHDDVALMVHYCTMIEELNNYIDPNRSIKKRKEQALGRELDPQEKNIVKTLLKFADKAEWRNGATADSIKLGIKRMLGVGYQLDPIMQPYSDALWRLLKSRRNKTDEESLMLTWFNIVGYCLRKGLLSGGSPALAKTFYPKCQEDDYKAIIKGKNGENATFKALEPLLDKYIK